MHTHIHIQQLSSTVLTRCINKPLDESDWAMKGHLIHCGLGLVKVKGKWKKRIKVETLKPA